jgi:RNA polymerase primary sigma factor
MSEDVNPTDILEYYLSEAGDHRILTREEEYGLGTRIQTGVQIERMLTQGFCLLSPQEVVRIRDDAREARHTLARHNIRLVVQVATKEYRKRGGRQPLIDLIQEGMVVLMEKVIPRYNPAYGTKFSTFAVWWIRQSITRSEANHGHTIRVPVHVQETVTKLKRYQNREAQCKGREVGVAEAAEALGMKPAVAEFYVRSEGELVSLDAPRRHNSEEGWGDVVLEAEVVDPLAEAERTEIRVELEEALEGLDARSAQILRLRYGLDGKGEKTLEQVAHKFRLTRERIRQIEVLALRHMRGNPKLYSLLRGEFAP